MSTAEPDDLIRSLIGRRVIRVEVGSGVHLGLDGAPQYTVTVECPLSITGLEGVREPIEPRVVERLTELVPATVQAIAVQSGTLRIGLGDGVEIVVAPTDMYEAWLINGSEGSLVVCLPGGGLSWWLPTPTE
jgi:hypothetical protein